MYYNKNLKDNLQNWSNRLEYSTIESFPSELKFLLNNIIKNAVLKGIIDEACDKYPVSHQELNKILDNLYYVFDNKNFENNQERAGFLYQIINRLTSGRGYNLIYEDGFNTGTYYETKNFIFENFLRPIIFYLVDVLQESNSILYLLEKYKRRTEWFTGKEIYSNYIGLQYGYEDYLTEDLRLFLFDQGIDYPFSTPRSPSGDADVVGGIDTEDPLVVEVKIYDESKEYRKNRIASGLTQIMQYTEDYGKHQGFLVIYNMDNALLNFELPQDKKFYPPMLTYNNRAYFFIIINLYKEESASKIGKAKVVTITTEDLMENNS